MPVGKYKYHIYLHLIVLMLGFTGILGKLISIDAEPLVWYRMLIAMAGLALFLGFSKLRTRLTKNAMAGILGTGLLIAAHWITFFHSIKVSNVSVALVCLASAALFTALMEPVFHRRRIVLYELLLGLFVIAGIWLIVQFETQYVEGVIFGLASAFFASLFTIFNGQFIKRHPASIITFYEMIGGVIGISAYFLFTGGFNALPLPSTMDWIYLVVLGLVCTSFGFAVSVEVQKGLSPYSVAIGFNMEPIYAILFAIWIFGDSEKMTGGFYLGSAIIIASIFLDVIIKNRLKSRAKPPLAKN